jgi:hypothetical protein
MQQLLLHLSQEALLFRRSRCCRRDCSGRRRLLLLELIQLLSQDGSFRLRVMPLLLLLLGCRHRGQQPLLRLCSSRLVLLQRLVCLLQLLSEHCSISRRTATELQSSPQLRNLHRCMLQVLLQAGRHTGGQAGRQVLAGG